VQIGYPKLINGWVARKHSGNKLASLGVSSMALVNPLTPSVLTMPSSTAKEKRLEIFVAVLVFLFIKKVWLSSLFLLARIATKG
jgi:hypothetical protein